MFANTCTSKEVIANLIRLFVGATAEEMHLEMITTPHNHCGYDTGENCSQSLCTILLNVNCCEELFVCYGVYAMSRELHFLTCGLEFLGSQTVSIVYGIIDSKSQALLPETAKSGFTDRRPDLFRSEEAERILLCEMVNLF